MQATMDFNTAVGQRWVATCPDCDMRAIRPSRGNAARDLQHHMKTKHGLMPPWNKIVDEMTEREE